MKPHTAADASTPLLSLASAAERLVELGVDVRFAIVSLPPVAVHGPDGSPLFDPVALEAWAAGLRRGRVSHGRAAWGVEVGENAARRTADRHAAGWPAFASSIPEAVDFVRP